MATNGLAASTDPIGKWPPVPVKNVTLTPIGVATGGFDESLFGAEEVAFSRALRRVGPVVILPGPVTTSGRKLRAHSGWEVARLAAAALRHGRAVVGSRHHLGMWYEARRDDPDG